VQIEIEEAIWPTRTSEAGSALLRPLEHDPEKVETGFPKKIMLNQRDEIMMRFPLIAS